MNPELPSSFLYVPACKPELFAKALASQASALILDLEDSVPPTEKEEAREEVREFLRTTPPQPKQIWVRINPPSDAHDLCQRELEMLATAGAAGVVLPKAELATVRSVAAHSPNMPVIGLIETARGFLQISDIAEERSLVGFGVGRADLLSELRVAPTAVSAFEQLALTIVVASAACELAAPIAPAHLQLARGAEADAAARDASQRFYDLGFRSQTSIHPRLCGVINSVFGSDHVEYDRAKTLLEDFDKSDGTLVTTDGQFVDEAVARRYREIVRRYERS